VPPSTSSSNRLCALLSRTMVMDHSARQEFGVLAVLFDVGFDEGTLCNDLQSQVADLIERAFGQPRPDTLAGKFRRHLGMNEGDDVPVDLVIGRGEMAFDGQLETMVGLVVDDFSHETFRSQDSQICLPSAAYLKFVLHKRQIHPTNFK